MGIIDRRARHRCIRQGAPGPPESEQPFHQLARLLIFRSHETAKRRCAPKPTRDISGSTMRTASEIVQALVVGHAHPVERIRELDQRRVNRTVLLIQKQARHLEGEDAQFFVVESVVRVVLHHPSLGSDENPHGFLTRPHCRMTVRQLEVLHESHAAVRHIRPAYRQFGDAAFAGAFACAVYHCSMIIVNCTLLVILAGFLIYLVFRLYEIARYLLYPRRLRPGNELKNYPDQEEQAA